MLAVETGENNTYIYTSISEVETSNTRLTSKSNGIHNAFVETHLFASEMLLFVLAHSQVLVYEAQRNHNNFDYTASVLDSFVQGFCLGPRVW